MLTRYISNKDSNFFLIQQYIEILFRKNKHQILIQYIFDKNSKFFFNTTICKDII